MLFQQTVFKNLLNIDSDVESIDEICEPTEVIDAIVDETDRELSGKISEVSSEINTEVEEIPKPEHTLEDMNRV